jgi:very-short-patch-repair endonuclease
MSRLANQIIQPADLAPQRTCDRKPRAERFKGPVARKKARARIEQAFLLRWDGPALVTEHRFHPVRKWRFDYAHVEAKVAVEVEGGIFSRGAHVRPMGIADDIDKGNAALELGWQVFRLCDLTELDEAMRQIKAAIECRLSLAPH